MKTIPPTVPSALILGIWAAENRTAIVGALRDECGNLVPDVLTATGERWTTVVQALDCAAMLDVAHVLILSNDVGLVRALSPPFEGPAPTCTERVWFSRHDWADIPSGGDPLHWQALRTLGGRWGGRFRAMQVDDLPKARELWQQSHRKSTTQ